MTSEEELYVNGFLINKFIDKESVDELTKLLVSIKNGNIKKGFEFKEKYEYSKDLRPNVYSYNDLFVDFLFKNKIPELIKESTGLDLYLAHIQLRNSFPVKGKNSYMSWHRDTHYYNNKSKVGNIPPAFKLIIYPSLDDKETIQLKVIKKSHHFIFDNKILDLIYPRIAKKEEVYSSNTNFLFFNTALHHKIINPTIEDGSFRLIYSFVRENQLEQYDDKTLGVLYRKKLKEIN